MRTLASRRAVVAGSAATALSVLISARASAAAPRVLHVDSYHRGNQWNDRIAGAIARTLEEAGVTLKTVHMDTKRKSAEEEKVAAGERVARTIRDWQPDVVTLSDDNAVKYVLQPHYRNASLPFVFCGLNWDASVYGLPYENTTGMIEVSPIPQIVELLSQHTSGRRLGYLAEDTPTKRKELAYHEQIFGLSYEKAWFVKGFGEWAEAFRQAQAAVDMLLLLGVGAITDWDDRAARELAVTQTAIPTGTDFEWLAHYALLGVAKLPEEQGEWAARAALRILEGVAPAAIPPTYNTKGELLFNQQVAARLGVTDVPKLARLIE